MKQLKPFAAICIAAWIFSMASCNPGEEKKTADAPADSSSVKAPENPQPAKPTTLLVIMHKVANYAKWQTGYEAHDSMRQAYGIHNYVLARDVKDTNLVMVALKIDDVAKAKAFVALPDLKAAMQKGGVQGTPTVNFLDVQWQDTTTNTTNTRVMVTHKVKDYAAWKKVYDEDKPNRVKAGFTDRLLAYNSDDNHMVSIVMLVSDMKKAEDFSKSPELKAKMEAGGVEGPPTFFYYTIAKIY